MSKFNHLEIASIFKEFDQGNTTDVIISSNEQDKPLFKMTGSLWMLQEQAHGL